MKENIPDTYTQTRRLICDCCDKKNYLVHYRLLKNYVGHGMTVDKVHTVISFEQSKWLKKYINFNFQKRTKAKNDFEKDFYKLLNSAFSGKTMLNFRNRRKIEFVKKDDTDKNIKQQSKMTFNGIPKSHETYDSYVRHSNRTKCLWIGLFI